MRKHQDELCVLSAIRRLWKVINNADSLEKAKENFRREVLNLILEDENERG